MEIWKDVKGYEGFYQVSNWGNVKSLRKNKLLKSCISKYGYYQVSLWGESKKSGKSIVVHRIVAKTFLDNVDNKPCVNHIDGIKTNNAIENLEWVSYRENQIHAFKIGLKVGNLGEKCPLHKLKESDVKYIRLLYNKYSTRKIAGIIGTSKSNVHAIVSNFTWKHIL